VLTREQALTEFDEGLKRFDRLIPPTSDTLVIVLKGHLLIEEQLQSLIEAAVRNPEVTREARLSFYQRLKFAQSIAGHFSKSLVWEATEALNSVRNRLVHLAEPAPTEELLSSFLQVCEKEERFSRARETPPGPHRLRAYIAHIWIILDALHDVVRVVRERMPLP
jgi:hypothetical protein